MFRSPRLALFTLCLTMLYTAVVCWLPWLASATPAPPAWAVRLGLDHPFRSLPFLAACLLLFVNTLACTCDRFSRTLRLWRGELPPFAMALAGAGDRKTGSLLSAYGFRGHGALLFKNRFALWGGFVLHVGILAIILSVALQQAFFDGGAFEIAEREVVSLDRPGVVMGRDAGYFARKTPPRIEVALDLFDANLHQPGYAPDRRSRLVVADPDHPERRLTGTIDRARGLAMGDATIYQAIPSGFALTLEAPQLGTRSIHLRGKGDRTAFADLTDPAGEPVRFLLDAEHSLSDPKGTGRLAVRVERRGVSRTLLPGESFQFGPGEARITGIARWGGFTYARTPGIGLVFAGFALALAGCFLMIFPAGVARLAENAGATETRIYLTRGADLLRMEWNDHPEQPENPAQPDSDSQEIA